MTKLQTTKRIIWIDVAKAIGILLVLVNHVMLDLGLVTFLGGMFYMPVFFVLSGYTFKESTKESLAAFIKNKAKRLLIPYLCFQLFLAGAYSIKNIVEHQPFIKAIFPVIGAFYSRNALYASEKDVLVKVPANNINLMSSLNAPLWFLTGLFTSLVIYKIILKVADKNKKKEVCYLAISVLIGVIFKYFCPILLPWSIDTAFISVAFLHVGRLLDREQLFERLCKKPINICMIVLVFTLSSFLNGSVNMSIREFGKSVLLYLLVGSLGTMSVMFLSKWIEKNLKNVAVVLEYIGRHTIGILALHLIVFEIISILATRFGVAGTIGEKLVKIFLAIVILVPIDWAIEKYLPFVYGKRGEVNEKRYVN
ncbi:acyltransferase family protein [Candidatus Galacturonibacter soehngenii]|uniref:Acyltransferase family protein n=1 Tax=Candidatus Galacturonatibacter soehngenii TaxID=2307010 RepID=A0A7V7QHI6_9FIRM|nr:acyltransferase family protein [Candidatus Galacturonibacter soehngenii]KAB1434403.1 acyltransferase family protein [Candidatus Galacturonibacter soehngenii]